MMFRNIFLKSLWDKRYSLVLWSAGVILFVLMVMLFYPSVNTTDYDLLFQSIDPDLLKVFVGTITSFNSPEGYLNSQLFFMIMPFIFLAFSILLGSETLAREEKKGTLELLLSTPISRWRVVLEKFAALTVANIILGIILFLCLVASVWWVDMNIETIRLWDISLALILFGVFFGGLSLALTCIRGNRELSMGLAGGLGVLSYFLNALAPVVEELEPYRELSVFYYYIGNDPILNGLDWWHGSVLLISVLLLVAVGIMVFQRRDLGT
jgi:ABC-2 type transport system permease protein